jgi:S-adenosylmethionine:tRNA ribosyltransferase-isomerase
MFTSDFDYNLPKELIAQTPVSPRDSSRLMVLDKRTQQIQHKQFKDIINYLSKGDLLVWNNTKVFKARLHGQVMLDEISDDISNAREKKFGLTDRILNMPAVEIFLVRPMENFGVWKVLAKPGRKLRLGMKVVFAEDFACEVLLKENDGTVLVQFNEDDLIVRAKANKYGEVPTPPYIGVNSEKLKVKSLKEQYQTVYAKHEGSVAGPTAGFHFTPELIEELKNKGVEFAEVTLHVGLGTFLPVKTEKVEDHKMHSEWVELTSANADKINLAKAEGRRVVAVGTTTVRTLEGVVAKFPIFNSQFPINVTMNQCNNESIKLNGKNINNQKSVLKPYTGDINIFITPGFKFQIIDALITNFHLPKSTLLMLVSAFVGDTKFVLECYQKAVEEKYRFYSFGDAMLIK